ncbi:MAG: low temperature requirement protein A [Dokdonella sp.]
MKTSSEPTESPDPETTTLLRDRAAEDSGKVGMVELFFDLVFVFAVTQVSHRLAAHPGVVDAIQAALLLAAIWWVWIYTSWATNFLDPATKPVRLMLFALMLGGLLMSAALPEAFAERGLVFAGAYVAMQVGRNAFLLWTMRRSVAKLRRNFERIMVWLLLSACFWIAGALVEGETRFVLWAIAIGLEIVSPSLAFWVPGMGRSETRDWNVDGHHMAERCALFVIIALGESVLMTGATFAESDWSATQLGAFAAAFVGSVAMWWIYFDTGADVAADQIAESGDPGRMARIAYTYIHVLIIAGIIVSAVADELVLTHPDHAETATVWALLGGPALFLTGTALFKWVTNERPTPPLSHLIGLLLLGLLVPIAVSKHVSALALCLASSSVLIVVAVWELRAVSKAPVKSTAS